MAVIFEIWWQLQCGILGSWTRLGAEERSLEVFSESVVLFRAVPGMDETKSLTHYSKYFVSELQPKAFVIVCLFGFLSSEPLLPYATQGRLERAVLLPQPPGITTTHGCILLVRMFPLMLNLVS